MPFKEYAVIVRQNYRSYMVLDCLFKVLDTDASIRVSVFYYVFANNSDSANCKS